MRVLASRNVIVGCLGIALATVLGLYVGRSGLASGLALVVFVVIALMALLIKTRYLLVAAIILLPFEFAADWVPTSLPLNLVPADIMLLAYALSATVQRLARATGVPRERAGRLLALAGILAVLLLLVGLASALLAGFSMAAVRKLGRIALILLAVWATPAALKREDAELGCRALVVVGILAAVYAIIEGVLALAGVETRVWQWVGPLPRLSSGFADPNFFAYFLALVIPVALARAIMGRKVRIWTVLGLVALVAAAVGTLSRGGAIGVAVGSLAVVTLPTLFGQGRRLSRIGRSISIIGAFAVVAGIIAASIPSIWSLASERFAGAVRVNTDPTGVLRLRIWRNALELLESSPIVGVGPGGFLQRITEASPDTAFYAHNSLLETTVEMGLIGGALLVAILAILVVASLRAAREAMRSGINSGVEDACAVGLAGALLGSVVASLFLSNALFLASTACIIVTLNAGRSRSILGGIGLSPPK